MICSSSRGSQALFGKGRPPPAPLLADHHALAVAASRPRARLRRGRDQGSEEGVRSLRLFDHCVRSIIPLRGIRSRRRGRGSWSAIRDESPDSCPLAPHTLCPKPSTDPANQTNRTNSTKPTFQSRPLCPVLWAVTPSANKQSTAHRGPLARGSSPPREKSANRG
jgi:hypothetical protein